jgi:hypothetical protein
MKGKTQKKLVLNKETITVLNRKAEEAAKGGAPAPTGITSILGDTCLLGGTCISMTGQCNTEEVCW